MGDSPLKLAGFKPSDVKYFIVPETGRTVEEEMRSAATRMVDYIQEGINDYYASYSPVVYKRTHQLKYSVLYSDIGSVKYSSRKAMITIEPNYWIWHNSLPFGGRGHVSNVFKLIDAGWFVLNGSHAYIYRFGWYEGFGFMRSAIDKFNSNNPLGIEVKY